MPFLTTSVLAPKAAKAFSMSMAEAPKDTAVDSIFAGLPSLSDSTKGPDGIRVCVWILVTLKLGW